MLISFRIEKVNHFFSDTCPFYTDVSYMIFLKKITRIHRVRKADTIAEKMQTL